MVKRLTEEEKNIISNCINDLIYNEMNKSTSLVAVYVTAYCEDKSVHIYVNFVDTERNADEHFAVSCKVKGIKIDKVVKSAWEFSCWPKRNMESLRNSVELLDCFYVYAYEGWNGRPSWYENYIKYAKQAGLAESGYAVTFNPQLDLSQKMK